MQIHFIEHSDGNIVEFLIDNKWVMVKNPDGTPYICLDKGISLEIEDFVGDFARIYLNGYTWVNKQGRIFSNSRFHYVFDFHENFANVSFGEHGLNWISRDGYFLNDKEYYNSSDFEDGFAKFRTTIDADWQVIDTYGIIYNSKYIAKQFKPLVEKYLEHNTLKLFIFVRFI